MSRRSLTSLSVFVIIIITSILIVSLARGYRINLETKDLKSTGLLVATSYPNGASVFIDGKLKTATDNTINLNPGSYKVKIAKEGYIPWEKELKIQGEIVTKTEAELFPSTPELRPLTSLGVIDPKLSPDGSKIAFFINNTENSKPPSKDGIWILNISERNLPFNPQSLQITRSGPSLDWSESTLYWSPSSKELLSVFYQIVKDKKTEVVSQAFLLSVDQINLTPQNVTNSLDTILASWEEDKLLKEKRNLESLPLEFQDIASASAVNIAISPDGNKVLYTATKDTTVPEIITPPLLGTNSQPEERNIKTGNIYVYDIKEDKNFLVYSKKPESTPKPAKTPSPAPKSKTLPSPTPTFAEKITLVSNGKTPLTWLATSRHLVYIENNAVNIMEYDSTNVTTVYGGPFEDSYLFPHLSGSKLIILTNYNKTSGSTPNLYAINLK